MALESKILDWINQKVTCTVFMCNGVKLIGVVKEFGHNAGRYSHVIIESYENGEQIINWGNINTIQIMNKNHTQFNGNK